MKPKSWSPWFDKHKFRDPIGERKRWEAGRAKYVSVWERSFEDMRTAQAERDREEGRKARLREIKFTAFLCGAFVALVFLLWLM